MTLHTTPPTNPHRNSMSAISQLLLTRFWWNFKRRLLVTSRTDSNCHSDICLGNICPGDICPSSSKTHTTDVGASSSFGRCRQSHFRQHHAPHSHWYHSDPKQTRKPTEESKMAIALYRYIHIEIIFGHDGSKLNTVYNSLYFVNYISINKVKKEKPRNTC